MISAMGMARVVGFVVTADGTIYTEIEPFVQVVVCRAEDGSLTVYERGINRFGEVAWQNVFVYGRIGR